MSNKNTKENAEEKVTNEGLAKLIESVATNLSGFQRKVELDNQDLSKLIESVAVTLQGVKQEVQGVKLDVAKVKHDLQEVRSSVRELQEGAFTKQEKEEVLAMVRDYDKSLEEDVRGEKRITLTRKEYNASSLAQGFPNRFDLAEVD